MALHLDGSVAQWAPGFALRQGQRSNQKCRSGSILQPRELHGAVLDSRKLQSSRHRRQRSPCTKDEREEWKSHSSLVSLSLSALSTARHA